MVHGIPNIRKYAPDTNAGNPIHSQKLKLSHLSDGQYSLNVEITFAYQWNVPP